MTNDLIITSFVFSGYFSHSKITIIILNKHYSVTSNLMVHCDPWLKKRLGQLLNWQLYFHGFYSELLHLSSLNFSRRFIPSKAESYSKLNRLQLINKPAPTSHSAAFPVICNTYPQTLGVTIISLKGFRAFFLWRLILTYVSSFLYIPSGLLILWYLEPYVANTIWRRAEKNMMEVVVMIHRSQGETGKVFLSPGTSRVSDYFIYIGEYFQGVPQEYK